MFVGKARRIGVISNTSWSVYNFRRTLIRELTLAGFEVVAMAPPDDYSPDVERLGCRYIPVSMNNKGRNPFQDLGLFFRLLHLFRREGLHCVLTFTVKPNIYGSIAARLLGIPSIANVAGLGSGYAEGSATQRVVQRMYRVALTHPTRVFFQNTEDLSQLTSKNVVQPERAERLPGSGVLMFRIIHRKEDPDLRIDLFFCFPAACYEKRA